MSFNIQEIWWRSKFSSFFKKRRLNKIVNLSGYNFENDSLKILDVGCSTGKDFISFFKDYSNLEFIGVDIVPIPKTQDNFTPLQIDADNLPFEDKSFDLTVSSGVLEHIEPIEKLCKVISEIERVSKRYIVIIPAINTNFEPHVKKFRWQLRDRNKKKQFREAGVNYYSDDAWTKFSGFKDAQTLRFSYIPGVLENLIIYKV